jgi:putative transcriptional regulator
MKRDLYKELEQSIKATGEQRRGQRKLKAVEPIAAGAINVRDIRERLNLSQASFALLIRTSKRTVQDWEQGRRQPAGPARALLRIADKRPDLLLETLVE